MCVCSEINELTLRQHFEECGCVEAVRVVRDQNSGLGKGFGYVLFEVRCPLTPATQNQRTLKSAVGPNTFSSITFTEKVVYHNLK